MGTEARLELRRRWASNTGSHARQYQSEGDSHCRSQQGRQPKDGVQVIAQEDQHDIDTAERAPRPPVMRFVPERSAYGTEAVVAKGLGINISKGEQAKGRVLLQTGKRVSPRPRRTNDYEICVIGAHAGPAAICICQCRGGSGKDDPHEEVLCAITKNPGKYDRDEVVLSARYVTDNRHEEVLRNSRCSDGARILDIGKHGAASSVARFMPNRSAYAWSVTVLACAMSLPACRCPAGFG